MGPAGVLVVQGEVTAEAVATTCSRQLAPYKRPKEIHVVAQLPLTHNGKVDRLRVPASLGY